MKKYIHLLLRAPLFSGIQEAELMQILQCLDTKHTAHDKGEAIFFAGNPAERIGLLLEGTVHIMRDDFFGYRSILAKLEPGDLFGEVFACAGVDTLPVSAMAATDCTVLLLDYRKIIRACPTSCDFHQRLIENMLRILAEKNLMLNQKLEILSARTIREKILRYLSSQAGMANSQSFSIPFNRQELADFLSIDRSALSRELAALQREDVLHFHKNHFEMKR